MRPAPACRCRYFFTVKSPLKCVASTQVVGASDRVRVAWVIALLEQRALVREWRLLVKQVFYAGDQLETVPGVAAREVEQAVGRHILLVLGRHVVLLRIARLE